VAATARAHARPDRIRPAPAPPPRPRPASRPRPRQAARPRVAGGVLWILLVAALLAGIVAVNVAALRLNLEAQRLEEKREQLQAENATAASELSSLASAARVEAAARGSLGLSEPAETRYVRARPRER
jgi:cell division protein FtsL